MKPPRDASSGTDALFAEVLRHAGNPPALRRLLVEGAVDESALIGVLRRGVPPPFLEIVAQTAPWSERPRVLGGVVLNPKTPRPLALRLLSSLYWRDLAEAAASPRLDGGVRARAEGLLKDQLPDLRLGERITLGRLATPPVLRALLADTDDKVLAAALENPRLREADLVARLQGGKGSRALIEAIAASSRWMRSYALRLALVLEPKTPLGIALAQLTSLVGRDLRRIASTPGLPPLVQAAAARVAKEPGER
jgi:hypothetical protein